MSLMALGADGSLVFRGRVPEAALASAGTPATGSDASSPRQGQATTRGPSRVVFDAPPGKVQLRISVEGASSQVLDSEVREIAVPDLTAAQPTLGTPAVLRARTLPEFNRLKADADAVPIAVREFNRTERLLIRIPAYGPGGTSPVLKV